jgi:hypothetical protein
MNAAIVTFLLFLSLFCVAWLFMSPPRSRVVALGGSVVCGVSLALAVLCVISSCSTPPTPAQTVKIASDLCGLRAIERAVLELDPKLAPPPDSLRAKVQATEDQLCAGLDDAGSVPPPAPS